MPCKYSGMATQNHSWCMMFVTKNAFVKKLKPDFFSLKNAIENLSKTETNKEVLEKEEKPKEGQFYEVLLNKIENEEIKESKNEKIEEVKTETKEKKAVKKKTQKKPKKVVVKMEEEVEGFADLFGDQPSEEKQAVSKNNEKKELKMGHEDDPGLSSLFGEISLKASEEVPVLTGVSEELSTLTIVSTPNKDSLINKEEKLKPIEESKSGEVIIKSQTNDETGLYKSKSQMQINLSPFIVLCMLLMIVNSLVVNKFFE